MIKVGLGSRISGTELVTRRQCQSLVEEVNKFIAGEYLSLDSKTRRSKYSWVKEKDELDDLNRNSDILYILMNTWGNIIADLCSLDAMKETFFHIECVGILQTIEECAAISDMIVHDNLDLHATHLEWATIVVQTASNTKDLLQVLRFPKRFSPFGGCDLNRVCILDFIQMNNSRKMRERRGYNPYITKRIREKIEVFLKNFKFDPLLGDFSGGTVSKCVDGKSDACLNHKLHQFAKVITHLYEWDYYQISDHQVEIDDSVEVQPVPKNFKCARIIGRMNAVQIFMLTAVRKSIELCLKHNGVWKRMPLDNAEVNRNGALIGSKDGTLATIDLTSASDCFTMTLLRECFPKEICDLISEWSGQNLFINGKKHERFIALTMGSPVTMVMQSLFYMALADVASDIFEIARIKRERKPVLATVYGDDIIIDVRVADLMMDLLSSLGFKPNKEKSFTTSTASWSYRESCGYEGLFGWDVSQVYFPRKPFSSGDIEVLIGLEKSLYSISRGASRFLCGLVLDAFPSMTASAPGTDCADLWWDYPLNQTWGYPVYTQTRVGSQEYESAKQRGDNMSILSPAEPYDVHEVRILQHDHKSKDSGIYAVYHEKVSMRYTWKACKKPMPEHPELAREKHFALVASKGTPKGGFQISERLSDMWYYTKFLKDGPVYLSPLDRLLGVSAPMRHYGADNGSSTSHWRLVE